jgi:hypothetical protein
MIEWVRQDLEKVYDLAQQGMSRNSARELIELIVTAERHGDFKKIDHILSEADVTKLSVHGLIGLVRTCARFRAQLPNWQPAYERAWIEMKTRGKEPKNMFVGLQEPTQA